MIEQNRQIDEGTVERKPKKEKEISDRTFFDLTGITPQSYPNLASDRLKREGKM